MGLFDRFKKTKISKRKYEGAARTKRNSGWYKRGTDANSEIKGDRATLRTKIKRLKKKQPNCKKGHRGHDKWCCW